MAKVKKEKVEDQESKSVNIDGFEFSLNKKGEILADGSGTMIHTLGGKKIVMLKNGRHFPLELVKSKLE